MLPNYTDLRLRFLSKKIYIRKTEKIDDKLYSERL